MTIGGRNRRPDDWPSSHVRARAAISERLDGPIPPQEAAWLAEHLEACPDCRVVAAAYEEQQRDLWALRDAMPPPPRDLWARTAAAIESEPRFRKRQAPALGWSPKFLIPSALIATALVVAVAAGTLTSSWRVNSGSNAESSNQVAAGTTTPTATTTSGHPGPTQIPVNAKIAVLTRGADGSFKIREKNVDSVCPKDATDPCDSGGATEEHAVEIDTNASTVFGSVDQQRLIVVSDPSAGAKGTVSVVALATPGPTSTPSTPPSEAPATPSAPPPSDTAASPPASNPASSEPSPSVAVSAPPGGPIEIAHDVALVGQSAAYSPSGGWFAFTARPVDGSAGPDIYVWRVGDALAVPVTTDHRSVFGSWFGDTMVGSTVVDVPAGKGASAKVEFQPVSFVLDPATRTLTILPQTGSAWRPAVDPSGRRAIYWTGSLRATTTPGFAPDNGKLVVGDWITGSSAPSDEPSSAPQDHQSVARNESTISAGRIDDWDARWDATGTHVAIWIADPGSSTVGRLSLYAVESFDGRIDLKTPLLDGMRASAGFAISDNQLVWAEPAADGSSAGSTVQLIAWTATGVGGIKTVTGPDAIVIR